MARGIAVCVVGAGSSYTPELLAGILAESPDQLPISEVRLTDVNAEKLGIMAGLSERMARAAGREIAILSDARLTPMLEGVDFVITQIRVGGMKARHLDESIPLRYGIIGQETTGPGGMLKALRTIPQMIEIARAVDSTAPAATILNYTNPSGIVTEAVTKYTKTHIIGLCSGMPGIQEDLRRRFGSRYPGLKSYTVGLNHFGFIYRVVSQGKDITREVIDALEAERTADAEPRGKSAGQPAGKSLNQRLGAIPISYVNYFYHRARVVAAAQVRPQTRAQEVEQIERAILAEASRDETTGKPKRLAQRGGGGYAGITFSVMKAMLGDTGEEITCNVPNRGAVSGIDDDAVVEVTCRVDREGAHPLPVGPIPLAFRGMVQALKAYETLTVEAAVHRDKRLAMQALLNHPLAGDIDVIERLLPEMLEAHGLDFS
jgi:6-phospho-beta-glucosidase